MLLLCFFLLFLFFSFFFFSFSKNEKTKMPSSSSPSSSCPQRPLTSEDEQKVPFKKFPTHSEIENHGLQPLPETTDVPQISPSSVLPFCLNEETSSSIVYRSWNDLCEEEVLELVRMLGLGFAKYEPMCRHLRAQLLCEELREEEYEDALGKHSWGFHSQKEKGIEKENLEMFMEDALTWWIRLCFVTNSSEDGRPVQKEVLNLSTVAIDTKTNNFLGAVLAMPAHIPSPPPSSPSSSSSSSSSSSPTHESIFHREAALALSPVKRYVDNMENTAIPALVSSYPPLQKAFENEKVTCCFMISKSSLHPVPLSLPVDLFRAHMEQQIELGMEYFVTEATNPWTGAVMEAMGATPTFFSPHRSVEGVIKSDKAVKEGPSSSNGWVSDKDSGAMFYVGRF